MLAAEDKAAATNRRVDMNASNPDHECTEYCFPRIAEAHGCLDDITSTVLQKDSRQSDGGQGKSEESVAAAPGKVNRMWFFHNLTRKAKQRTVSVEDLYSSICESILQDPVDDEPSRAAKVDNQPQPNKGIGEVDQVSLPAALDEVNGAGMTSRDHAATINRSAQARDCSSDATANPATVLEKDREENEEDVPAEDKVGGAARDHAEDDDAIAVSGTDAANLPSEEDNVPAPAAAAAAAESKVMVPAACVRTSDPDHECNKACFHEIIEAMLMLKKDPSNF